MENKERDIFAEARAFLKAEHLAVHHVRAEGLCAVKVTEDAKEEKRPA